jgi:fatty acid desaturase
MARTVTALALHPAAPSFAKGLAMFKTNVGTADRIARLVLGLVLIALTLGVIGTWGWVGVVPLLTAALGSCPLYSVFGISSCPLKKA